MQRTHNNLTILKKNKVGGLTLCNFKTYHKTIFIKTVWYWHKEKCIDYGKELSSEINLYIYGQSVFEDYSMRKEYFFQQMRPWATGYSQAKKKKIELGSYFIPHKNYD